jgi:hypothetical protein
LEEGAVTLFVLKDEILSDIARLKEDKCTPSQIVRYIFRVHGQVSPPLSARYFEKIYGIEAADLLPAFTAWWPDGQTGYTDADFDRLMGYVFERANKSPK